jgi:DNA repair protein RecN (Recombination protein N)
MLTCLRIHQFAIVPHLEVAFGPGLNVVTGETGSGKSILVHALQLVLGARARVDVVRAGAEQAEVEALFDIGDDAPARARLAGFGLEAERELVIRRVIQANGRSRAYVNGRLATLTQLVGLARGLVDISSQHEHHTLADAASHLGYLDAFARLDAMRSEMSAVYQALSDAVSRLRAAESRLVARGDRGDFLRFQLAEIDRVKPLVNEDVSLADEVLRLRQADRLTRAAEGAEQALSEGAGAVVPRLKRLAVDLAEVARVDERLAAFSGRVSAAAVELDDAARELGRYARDVWADPGRLAEVEERLHDLRRLARRHGGALADVIAQRERLSAELQSLDSLDDAVASLEVDASRTRAAARGIAERLSELRQRAAMGLADAISGELASLGMGGARIVVRVLSPGEHVEPEAASGADPIVGGIGPTGWNRVEFLIAPNPGEEPRPLARVASGGELSRSLLALKRVLAGLGPVGLYVFDEVDSGVGGAVASVIGAKLAEVARHHQVLCVTHLAQIAAYGDAHLHVHKLVSEGRTESRWRRLSAGERVDELARMIGGVEVTPAARVAAADLLEAAAIGRDRLANDASRSRGVG